MPRTNRLGVSQKDKQNEKVRACVWGLLKARHMTVSEFSKQLGMGAMTLYRRMDNPGSFSLDELRKLNKILKENEMPTLGEEVIGA